MEKPRGIPGIPIPPRKQTEFRFNIADIISNTLGITYMVIDRYKEDGRGTTRGKTIPWYAVQPLSGKRNESIKYTQPELFKLLKAGWKHHPAKNDECQNI